MKTSLSKIHWLFILFAVCACLVFVPVVKEFIHSDVWGVVTFYIPNNSLNILGLHVQTTTLILLHAIISSLLLLAMLVQFAIMSFLSKRAHVIKVHQ